MGFNLEKIIFLKTAKENYEAVKQFFKIYPSFRNNYLFISGESYAGVYVPSLCALIVDGQNEYPLKLTVNYWRI